jgi:hypothetical protein
MVGGGVSVGESVVGADELGRSVGTSVTGLYV